jgi:small subunit ribosomal protein S4
MRAQPREKISRRLGVNLFLKGERSSGPKSAFTRRPYPPGLHGPKRQSKLSQYGLQLREKQKVRFSYGLSERQLARYFHEAAKSKEKTGEKLLELLERRLDNIVYRLGLAASRRQARQMVSHGLVRVNGKKVDIPSYTLNSGDVVSLKKTLPIWQLTQTYHPPVWLDLDKRKLSGTVVKLPARDEIGFEIDEKMVVEFYSR